MKLRPVLLLTGAVGSVPEVLVAYISSVIPLTLLYWIHPAKLAPSVSGLDRAKRKYHGLNRDALKLVDPVKGGLLLTCTCSAAMTQKDGGQYFLNMVQQAAIAAGRRVTLLQTSGAAPCHTASPASFPAGSYLMAALFYVSPL